MDLVVGASNDAVKSLVGKLGSLLAQEYTLIGGVSDDIQYINDELASMQAFLNRLKQEARRDEQRQDWMKQVREVAYDIEDCVDNASHRLSREPRGSGKLASLRRAWYLLHTLYARHCIATEIRNLKVRAQHVSERRTRYGVENPARQDKASDSKEATAPFDCPAPPPQLIGTVAPVGIEHAKEKLKPWFMEAKQQSTAHDQPRFLAIVGFGGLGKTTLAMALYREFGDEFDCRATVLASQKFHLLTVLRSLIKQFHDHQAAASKHDIEGIEEWGQKELKELLARQLKDKRYHIFIDDIWSVSALESIRDSFPKSKNGSSIVVTTRFKSVAEACRRQQGRVHELLPLSDDNPYKLFRQIISRVPNVPTDGAKALLKKCGGLPLAIILVAGLVASKLRSKSDDIHVECHHLAQKDKNVGDELETNKALEGNDISKRLDKVSKDLGEELEKNLSTEGVTHIVNHCYYQLPADLKTCLLYLSMFPKGCLISRKRLIRRWIAEGFIAEKHGKTVDEVAEDCFNELISRNLIRAVNSSSNGKVKSCQVHDMVLEYIVVKSSDENFITVVGGHWHTPFPSYKVRRLSVQKSGRQEKETVERMKLSHVRSLTAMGSFRSLHSTLSKFQILQVLDLESCKDLSLMNQVEKICDKYQLKYLSLRGTDIERSPKKIGRLEYLQVLDIRDTNILQLPPSVEKLQHMVHLLAGSKSKRIGLTLTEGITKMMALQTLSGVEICGSSANAASAKVLQALENLTNLKKLTVYRLRAFSSKDNILLLSVIEHLSSCSLKFLAIDDNFTGFLDSSLNASEAPPEHLHTLGLSGKLSQVPHWISRLHNLEKLTLSLTSLTEGTLPVLGGLPELFSLIFVLDNSAKKYPSVLQILTKNAMESGGEIFGVYGLENLRSLRHVLLAVSSSAEPLGSVEPGLPSFQPNFDHVQGNILRGDPSIDDCYRLILGLGFLEIDEVYDMTHA
uniref:AAA+ ATPase domain-containing protein n=1 Tax=Setaria italica TaxID=4555 RepID=K3ZLJ6_SETIT